MMGENNNRVGRDGVCEVMRWTYTHSICCCLIHGTRLLGMIS
jgi:hypothetical protein